MKTETFTPLGAPSAQADLADAQAEIIRLQQVNTELLEAVRLGLRAMRSLGWDEAAPEGPSAQLRRWFDQAYAAWQKAEGR